MSLSPPGWFPHGGYGDLSDPVKQFRVNHWLYALCWIGAERLGILFDRVMLDCLRKGPFRRNTPEPFEPTGDLSKSPGYCPIIDGFGLALILRTSRY